MRYRVQHRDRVAAVWITVRKPSLENIDRTLRRHGWYDSNRRSARLVEGYKNSLYLYCVEGPPYILTPESEVLP